MHALCFNKHRNEFSVVVVALTFTAEALFTSRDVNGKHVRGMTTHNCRGKREQCATDSFVRNKVMNDHLVSKVEDKMASGRLNCSELFDHPTLWHFELGELTSMTASRDSFEHGLGGFYTWCGTDITCSFTTVCATWHESMVGPQGVCNPQSFILNVRKHQEGGTNVEYRSTPMTGGIGDLGIGDSQPNMAVY